MNGLTGWVRSRLFVQVARVRIGKQKGSAVKKKFENYAEALYDAGFVVSTRRENYEHYDLTKGQVAYLLSLLGKKYYGFGLYTTFNDMYENHQSVANFGKEFKSK